MQPETAMLEAALGNPARRKAMSRRWQQQEMQCSTITVCVRAAHEGAEGDATGTAGSDVWGRGQVRAWDGKVQHSESAGASRCGRDGLAWRAPTVAQRALSRWMGRWSVSERAEGRAGRGAQQPRAVDEGRLRGAGRGCGRAAAAAAAEAGAGRRESVSVASSARAESGAL
ncbi:hypothetical protein T440DRAFT_3882 [Plenodomus tracheiphilus IPT5]|uniref:Uncharacterized protein n=1 Tax=Plenodomus tracheiphilus IPT5 TaxID=1408161 RepID=A0A6A7BMD9_9PLEO|nr:hypothetical protein T440DRAFT_3882 [Plenodomus tracheiphilus IPT5]